MKKDTQTIAPCGMNCGICSAFLREERTCPGCFAEDSGKPKSCQQCIIKNCIHITANKSGFCFECGSYPCKRLQDLDKRYSTKYRMSMIENLNYIKQSGLQTFMANEDERWHCASCGGVVCVHYGICLVCGTEGKQGIVNTVTAVKLMNKLRNK